MGEISVNRTLEITDPSELGVAEQKPISCPSVRNSLASDNY